ncbi:DNA-dependent protein kinase catalytic subunit, partial [Globisporangium splendens]
MRSSCENTNDGKPLDDGYVNFLGDLLCHIINAYPRCAWKNKHYVYKSVLILCEAVSKRTIVQLLVDRFVFHMLLLTISNITDSQAAVTLYHPETGSVESKLLYEYESLWVGLLCVPASAATRKNSIQSEAQQISKNSLKLKILDSLVKSILRVFSQLNLSYRYDLETSSTVKDFGGYKPNVPRDHTIMLNATEFLERIVPRLTGESISPWIPSLLQYTIQQSEKLPVVSSFYHIGKVIGRLAEEVGFFAESSSKDAKSSAVYRLKEEYSLFVGKVCAQLRFYKDELLVASADFVLSTPRSLISVQEMIPAVSATLTIGKSYLSAADIGVSALERWQKDCPDQLDASLEEVIPLLSPYLNRSDEDTKEQPQRLSSTKSAPSIDEEGMTEFGKIQRRILVLLGKIGGNGSLVISGLSSSSNDGETAGGCRIPQFDVSLELSDMSICLAMDKVMIQTGDLAVHSTDRRLKIGACETFHALVCYLCGKTATHPHSSDSKSVFYQIWKKTFPMLVLLATDAEKICRTLFEPLLFQVIRWLCSSSDSYPFEFSMILDELAAGLSQPGNSAVREMSGKAFSEVLSSSIEHEGNTSRSVARAEIIFERLFSLCQHPSSVQRIGGAVTINYVVRSLNQDNTDIISAFALRCIKAFLYSLRLCDRDDQNGRGGMEIARQIIQRAVLKLERAISRFPHLFMRKASGSTRSVSSSDSCLEDMTEWLFKQTMRRERSFREVCQKIFISFASLVSGAGCKKWIVNYAGEGQDVTSILAPMDSLVHIFPTEESNSEDAGRMIDWLEHFAASVDSFAWCIQILDGDASSVLSMPSGANKHSSKRRSDASGESEMYSTQEKKTFTWAIDNFLNQDYPQQVQASSSAEYLIHKRLGQSYTLSLSSLCRLLSPSLASNGESLSWLIDIESGGFQEKLSKRLIQCLGEDQTFSSSASTQYFHEIKDFCRTIMASKRHITDVLRQCALEMLDPMMSNTSSVSLLITQLIEANILDPDQAKRYKQDFVDAAFKSIQKCSTSTHRYRDAVEEFKAALRCGWDVTQVFQDEIRKEQFASVYQDIVLCLPSRNIWRESSESIVNKSLKDGQVLSLLQDVLRAVVGIQVFKPETTEWDEFAEVLSSIVKLFVQAIQPSGPDVDIQRQRTTIQIILYFMEIYEGCSKSVKGTLQAGSVPDIRDKVVDLLNCRDTSYLVKADLLNVLARLNRCTGESDNGKESVFLIDTLEKFIAEEFPIVSTDVKLGTKDYDVYQLLFRHLLVIIEESRSVKFLKLLFPSLKEGSKHLLLSDLKLGLASVTEKLSSNTEARDLLELADILLDVSVDISVRMTLLENVFTPLMELENAQTMKAFFLSEMEASKVTMITGSFFSAAVGFALVEILFRLADPEFIRNEVNAAFLGHANGKGREFTMLVCKCASKMVTKSYGEVSDTVRFACCEAYNCLLTAVSRTQKQEKFFDQILFQDALWSNIIDASQEYKLYAETGQFEKIPLSRLSVSTLKTQQQTQDTSLTSSQGKRSRDSSSTLRFFSASSLSQTALFATASTQSFAEQDAVTAGYSNVEIELDSINEHACMVPILRTILLMKDEFGGNWESSSMPSWMQKIFNVVANSLTELNIRLFLVKIVLNVPDLFSPYASAWLEKILDTVLEATFNMIMQDNILLVTQLIMLWKGCVSIDTAVIEKFLFSDEVDTRLEAAERVSALQILSAMLAVGAIDEIQVESTSVYSRSITDGVLLALHHTRPIVYTIAAEVGGMCLQNFRSKTEAFTRSLSDSIVKAYNEEDYGRFLTLLRNVSLHYFKFIDAMMLQRVCSLLPRVIGIEAWSRLAIETLENASKNADVIQLIFPSIQPTVSRFTAHRDPSVQYAALRVLNEVSDHLGSSELELLIKCSSDGGVGVFDQYGSHADVDCRKLLYSMAMKFYGKSLSAGLKDDLRRALLGGLSDSDAGIREELLAFWNSSALIPSAASQRLLELFHSLYAPKLADKWVFYATNILVLTTKGSDAYESPMFPSPLTKSEFHDTDIDTTWEGKSQTMAPLFSIESDKFTSRLSSLRDTGSMSQSFLASLTEDVGSMHQSQLVSSALGSQDGLSQSSQSTNGTNLENGARSSRKRFSKRPAASSGAYAAKTTSRFFKEQYALLRKHEQAVANRQRRARKQQVSMKRKYRMGDYPDIQIKIRDIIEPIMALFLSSEFQKANMAEELTERLQRALSRSKLSPSFIGCIHLAYFTTISLNPGFIKRVAIPASFVGGSSLASGNYHSGELILEEILNHYLHTEGIKESHNSESYESVAEYRDQLYKILATIQKSNLLIALSSSCCTVDESKIALQAQISGDLPFAIASYKKAESILAERNAYLNENKLLSSQFEAQRCYWERMGCLEKLNHWEKLEAELTQSEGNDLSFIWKQDPPYLEQGIGHCVRSYLGTSKKNRDGEARSKMAAFIDAATKVTNVWDLLTNKFCVELCLMYLELGEISRVRVLAETFYTKFLTRWQNTSPVATLPRLELMQSLSSIVEMDELLALMQASGHQRNDKQLERAYVVFNNKWTRAYPSDGYESMSNWSRFYMVQEIVGNFTYTQGSEEGILSDASQHELLLENAQVMLKYAKAAVSNDFLALASKYLKEYREVCNQKQLPKVSVLMIDVFVSHVLKLADRQATKSQGSSISSNSTELTKESIMTITRYYEAAARMFDNDDILTVMENSQARERVAIGCLEAKTFGKAAEFYMATQHDPMSTQENFTRAIDVFQRSCKTISSHSEAAQADRSAMEVFKSCRLSFVEFLVDLLFKDGHQRWEEFIGREELTRLLAENVLNGMMMGNQECSNYFPQLCEVIAPYPDIVAYFEREMLQNVPIWTCLRWAAQLMALFNGPISSTILRILEKVTFTSVRMAKEYPAALFYDFKVACAGNVKGFKVDLTRLSALLANPVMEKFVDALRLIHHPELRLKEGLREVARYLDESKATTAVEVAEKLWNECFSLESPSLGSQIGRYNREWGKQTKKDMEKILGKNGKNITPKSVMAAREWIMNNFSVVPGRYGITKDMKSRLVDFAEWLEEFDHTKSRLELPGQYSTYWGKPDPSSHVQILRFSSMLGVLASKQLPKQITMHCSDEKDYTFLVKGGEDLRLDQRIEQLFDVMNQILHADPRCRDRNLVTRTYKVIPMTQEIGIIEWLHDTSTLKGMIENRLQKDDRCADLQSNKRQKLQLFNTTPAKNYETFLMKQRGGSFCAKVIAPQSADVKANFQSVQALIPGDLLRRQLLDISSNFESFLSVRDHFARSLAVFSACSYILGIGDRHLDNFLLDLRTGAVIGIDFGVSFGAGASVLPVPELIPFRYTRQMNFVFEPYDGLNLLTQDMQAVFGALRDKKQVVESVMNVFLHEPLLDWQKSTMTHQKEIFVNDKQRSSMEGDHVGSTTEADTEDDDLSQGRQKAKRARTSSRQKDSASASSSSASSKSSAGAQATAWLPNVKIAIARRKLEGFSPRILLKEELAQNPHLGSQLKSFHALVDSLGGEDSSHDQQRVALSPLAQTQELLAMATSPDLLGRTYHGWMPWL